MKKLGHDDTRRAREVNKKRERKSNGKKTETNKHSWWILRVKKEGIFELILKNWNCNW